MCPEWNKLFSDPTKIIRRPDMLADHFISEVRHGFPVYDLGCGAGRHLVHLAAAGLNVIGGDISPVGLHKSREWLEEIGLIGSLLQAEMTLVPFKAESLGGVISINVLNHGTVGATAAAIRDVHRVLMDGAPFFFLIIGRQDARYGEGEEIEPHTFIPRQGVESGVPHHYYTRDELIEMTGMFTRCELEERRRPYDDKDPVFGNDPRLKVRTDAFLQHWAVKTWK